MPRASAADAARTADAILDAATGAFAQAGFHAASVGRIATAAGVTRGAVYHHFTDKLGLLEAVVRAGHKRVAATVVDRADAQGSDERAALRAGCHAFIEGITGDEAARVLLIDGPTFLGWSHWRSLDADTSMTELRDAVRALTPQCDVEAVTRLLSGAMNEGAVWLVESQGDAEARASLHRALDRLIDTL